MLLSGISDEMDRPGMSKDLGSGGTEESGRPGSYDSTYTAVLLLIWDKFGPSRS